MTRNDFLRKVVRTALLLILGLVSFALGGRIVSANECSGCGLRGKCTGANDCEIFKRKVEESEGKIDSRQ